MFLLGRNSPRLLSYRLTRWSRLDIAVLDDADTRAGVAPRAKTEMFNSIQPTQVVADRESATPPLSIPGYLRVCRPSSQLTSACSCFLSATTTPSLTTCTSHVCSQKTYCQSVADVLEGHSHSLSQHHRHFNQNYSYYHPC